jgi:ElaB/YqjD/DUF883 family membrane-anchored ribosome-binding protein
MSNDPSPLKYMGTQSQESVAIEAMAAALVGEGAGPAANAGSRLGDATGWVVDKARDAAQATAHRIGKRTTKAVEGYTRDDPVRALLIAAGTGALLMVLVAQIARSGARSVTRRLGVDARRRK